MKDEQRYTVEAISAFLAGTGGEWDWDDFTSCPLRDRRMESIRRRALAVDLPIDEEGEAVLRTLVAEAKAGLDT
ncbi:hypothetical protein [Sphingobium sp.]|uniref:hypothetical protein n=1 Tax=Sphingobium sp. TaxID=1912891 RepID=UPI00260FF0AF|nr:hypothetical protein [Sphingobium sp.]